MGRWRKKDRFEDEDEEEVGKLYRLKKKGVDQCWVPRKRKMRIVSESKTDEERKRGECVFT